jgi:hypothetical protein
MMHRIYEGSIYVLMFVIVGLALFESFLSIDRLLTLAAHL